MACAGPGSQLFRDDRRGLGHPHAPEADADREWWVRLNATRALANMGSAGEHALVDVIEGTDRYARDQAAATLEARGITRQMVEELADSNKKGERARRAIRAIIRAGATKHLRRLAKTMPDGQNRRALQTMLEEANDS